MVMSSARPFICMAPSPAKTIDRPVGVAELGADAVRDARAHGGQVAGQRAAHVAAELQLAGVPVRRRAGVGGHDGVVGQPRRQLAEQPHRVDRVGLDHRPRRPSTPTSAATLASMSSRQDRSSLRLQVRDQRAQRGGRVADQVDLVRVAHPDELAVDVDLDRRAPGRSRAGTGCTGSSSPTVSRVSQSLIIS